ncbi:MAG: hypothetical protein V3S69_05510 [Dehalococcoidales bacterium]
MNLLSIAKKVGLGILRDVVPGGGLILQAVNELLPEDKKLPPEATGEQVKAAAESLPPEQRARLLEREFDVEETQIKESNETLRTMLQADATSTHTTRPYIAKGAFQVVAAVVLVVTALWAYGVGSSNTAMVKTIMEGWPFVLGVIGPFIMLLRAYFGVLKQEHRQRLDAAGGTPSQGIAGALSSLLNK